MDDCRIYLAEQRGLINGKGHQAHCTLNYGSYHDESHFSAGRIRLVNDEFLAPECSFVLNAPAAGTLIVIPVTGDLRLNHGGKISITAVGECMIISVTTGKPIVFSNPFESETINFIVFLIAGSEPGQEQGRIFPIPHHAWRNQLVGIFPETYLSDEGIKLSLGQFDGRKEAVYQKASGKSIFVFVLAGAFEIQGRLLHPRDGLFLQYDGQVELEALSDHATLILIET